MKNCSVKIGKKMRWIYLGVLMLATMATFNTEKSEARERLPPAPPQGTITVGPPQLSFGAPTGNLTASPNPCIIPANGNGCATTISWTTSGLSGTDEVAVYEGFTTLLACAPSGSRTIQIPPGLNGSGIFLKAGVGACRAFSSGLFQLGVLNVQATYPVRPTGTITASPNPCKLTAGATFCSPTISWTSANAGTVGVWVGMDGAPSKLMGCAPNYSEPVPWIVPGHSYYFTLVGGPNACTNLQQASNEAYLGNVTVTGTF